MNWNRALLALACIISLLAGNFGAKAEMPDIIPLPVKLELQPGTFVLAQTAKIVVSPGAEETGRYLAAELGRRVSIHPDILTATHPRGGGDIELTVQTANFPLGEEGYTLVVKPGGVIIKAGGPTGLFYGVQSFLQLLPVAAESDRTPTNRLIPCVTV